MFIYIFFNYYVLILYGLNYVLDWHPITNKWEANDVIHTLLNWLNKINYPFIVHTWEFSIFKNKTEKCTVHVELFHCLANNGHKCSWNMYYITLELGSFTLF